MTDHQIIDLPQVTFTPEQHDHLLNQVRRFAPNASVARSSRRRLKQKPIQNLIREGRGPVTPPNGGGR